MSCGILYKLYCSQDSHKYCGGGGDRLQMSMEIERPLYLTSDAVPCTKFHSPWNIVKERPA